MEPIYKSSKCSCGHTLPPISIFEKEFETFTDRNKCERCQINDWVDMMKEEKRKEEELNKFHYDLYMGGMKEIKREKVIKIFSIVVICILITINIICMLW